MNAMPERFVFMKVGNHAGETWEQILARKNREFEAAGRIFWGYGGNTCHPITAVQPFARLSVREYGEICLVMQPIDSKAHPDIFPAREFSRDGIVWEPIPAGISVIGSRYAMVLDEIRPGELDFDMSQYEVGMGPSIGKAAEDYIRGRVDKGCFRKSERPRILTNPTEVLRKIGFVASLKDPFAVLLR